MNIIKHIIRRIKEGMLKDMLRQTVWIYGYARHYWKSMIFYTLSGLTGTAIGLLSSIISKDLVDIITGHQTGELLKTFCMMIGFTIGSQAISQFTSYLSSKISIRVDNEIKADIYEKMLSTDWEAITHYHTGDLLVRWSSDASNISNGILSFIPNLIIYLFKFIMALGIVIYHDATFAIFALIGMPVSVLMSRKLMNRMVNNNKRSAALNAEMSGFNQESLSNIQTIKAFDLIKLYCERLKDLQTKYLKMRLEFNRMSAVTSFIMAIVGMAVSYSCYGWGIYRVWSGAISYGTMTLFLSLSGQLTGTLNSLISLVPTAINLTTSAGRLMDILNMPRDDYSQTEEVTQLSDMGKKYGIRLEISNMSYKYNSGTEVFKNVSFEAAPHEIVALVGPSGEGKTTMLRILLSLLHPYEGTCLLKSGENYNNSLTLSPAARALFSYVPQGNTMFSGTIADNMRSVKPDAADSEIIEALKLSCAWEFVSELPDTINSEIKERGGGFSEGQAQRLSIARAILRKSPILLLDEATSALDVTTERNVLKNIMKDDYPRTCIVTTHRPTVLTMCDRVYSIHDMQCTLLNDDEIEEITRNF